jgi:hypothetical protein
MNHSATIKRLLALENIRKTVSPSCGRSREHIAGLLTDVYSSLWSSDATLQSREERYTQNLRLVEGWSHSSLTDKLEKYQGLFNEV